MHSLLDGALNRRAALIADLSRNATDAWRVISGTADGLEGVYLDVLGDVAVLQVQEARFRVDISPVGPWALEHLGVKSVFLKRFPANRSAISPLLDAKAWVGSDPSSDPLRFSISEYGVKFEVRPCEGFSYGLMVNFARRLSRR